MDNIQVLNELFCDMLAEKESQFIQRAIRKWDRLSGCSLRFDDFIRFEVTNSWEKLFRRN